MKSGHAHNEHSAATDCSTDAESRLMAIAMEAAEALEEEWSIGESSRFCDDPPDWASGTAGKQN